MSLARNLADLLDSNGAVKASSIATYDIDYLAIGGGAQGGFGRGGGGGAGEHQESSCSVLKGKVYTITVGAGGSSNLGSGNSSFILGDGVRVKSLGGGYGAQGLATGLCGGSGGSGGGGAGDSGSSTGTAGTANTGGGGGGGGNGALGGAGGSGIVILKIATSNYSGTTTGSPTVTTSGSNTILQYTGSGTYTA